MIAALERFVLRCMGFWVLDVETKWGRVSPNWKPVNGTVVKPLKRWPE